MYFIKHHSSLDVFQPFGAEKNILNLLVIQKQAAGWIWPMGLNLLLNFASVLQLLRMSSGCTVIYQALPCLKISLTWSPSPQSCPVRLI